jgi:hypothetical protein
MEDSAALVLFGIAVLPLYACLMYLRAHAGTYYSNRELSVMVSRPVIIRVRM